MPDFSQRLKATRMARRIKQAEIAEKLGVSVQSYSAYENGREPNYKTLRALCALLDVDLYYLLGVNGEPKSKAGKSVFADRLALLLQGDSQSNLSRATGVTRQAISSYLSGGSEPTICRLTAIAKYFGVSSDYLIGLTDDPTPHAPNIPITSNADIAALLNEIATIAQFRATRIKSEEEG